jgi:hypothetical protein
MYVLIKIQKEKKTKEGYLKDGFVVSDDNSEDEEDVENDVEEEEDTTPKPMNDGLLYLDGIENELEEEPYDYESESE